MQFEVIAIEVSVRLEDAPQITALTGYSGKERTIRPINAALRFAPNADAVRVTLLGPLVRPSGSESASYFEVKTDVRPDSADNAEWLRDLVESVRPS